MAKQKKWNRALEQDLHTLEWLSSLGGTYPRDWLYEAWQDVMLYQFHDCLPGSAIDRVYAQTQARYAQLHLEALRRIEEQKQFLAAGLNADGMEKPVAVFNPAPVDRTEYLERDGRELPVSVPAYGIAVVDLSTAQPITRTTGRDGFWKMIGFACPSAWMGPWTASTTNAPNGKCSLRASGATGWCASRMRIPIGILKRPI